ncbi:amidase [Xylophilus sp. GOD-11R]|uniref:amidase n=1 Tax=Xylophilus sp. GOD-11R TaxID=3089814 RepID=UPI00298BD2CE|nr:amidase [Xylophilus sp. GOD-11R]WPB57313.1 amidase [Xylophilus sp. GOD-11R]
MPSRSLPTITAADVAGNAERAGIVLTADRAAAIAATANRRVAAFRPAQATLTFDDVPALASARFAAQALPASGTPLPVVETPTADHAEHAMTLVQAVEALRSGATTSVQLTQAAIARAEAHQETFNAFVRIDADAALAQAARCDEARARGEATGPLHGVPLAHKDMFHRAGQVSTCGSKLRRDWVAGTTAGVLQRLDAAGALQVGTLHMTEFAYGPTGQNAWLGDARNPWNREHLTGGSSSGSAVSVASGMVFGALGSDTGGSVRMPAALCGVTGMKTTPGLVSRAGCMPLSHTLDTIGPLTRTVQDNALMLSVIAGFDAADPASIDATRLPGVDLDFVAAAERGRVQGLEGVRIGLPRGYFDRGLSPEVAGLVDAAAQVLRERGATLVPVDMPDLDAVNAAGNLITWAEAVALHAPWMRERAGEYGAQTRGRIESSLAASSQDYLDAKRHAGRALAAFVASVFGACDVLLAPALAFAVPRLDQVDVSGGDAMLHILDEITRLTRPANVLGLPALALPCGFTGGGASTAPTLPCGMQLIGRPFAESLLLQVGAGYQAATDWHRRLPAGVAV